MHSGEKVCRQRSIYTLDSRVIIIKKTPINQPTNQETTKNPKPKLQSPQKPD